MKKFNLMRRLSKDVAARCENNSFYEFTNEAQEWMAVPATGRGLMELLEEAEKRIKGTAGFMADACQGEHHEYFVQIDGKTILNDDDLINMINLYIDIRGTHDDEFVNGYFSREAKFILQH